MATKLFHLIVEGDESGSASASIPELGIEVYAEYGGATSALAKLGSALDTCAEAVSDYISTGDKEDSFEFIANDSDKLVVAQKLLEMFGKKDATSK